jgi:hypothetical protein
MVRSDAIFAVIHGLGMSCLRPCGLPIFETSGICIKSTSVLAIYMKNLNYVFTFVPSRREFRSRRQNRLGFREKSENDVTLDQNELHSVRFTATVRPDMRITDGTSSLVVPCNYLSSSRFGFGHSLLALILSQSCVHEFKGERSIKIVVCIEAPPSKKTAT